MSDDKLLRHFRHVIAHVKARKGAHCICAEVFKHLSSEQLHEMLTHFFGTEPVWANVDGSAWERSKHQDITRDFRCGQMSASSHSKRQKGAHRQAIGCTTHSACLAIGAGSESKIEKWTFECPHCELNAQRALTRTASNASPSTLIV